MDVFKGNGLPYNVRVSILEERLQAYDEVSKQMLTKLEQAVEKISESTRDISQILVRHEERIDRATETNSAIEKLIEKTETELSNRIDQAENDIEDLKRNRWIWLGAIIASSFFLSQIRVFEYIMPPPPSDAEQIREV